MSPKTLFAPLATAAILAGALLLPAEAFAHDRHQGGHHRYDHGWSHHGRHKHKHKHKHERRVIHEHRYEPVYVPARPYWRGDRHNREYGSRNRVTITYSGGWD
jgi:Ni/Co efflux regulator RcnB